MGNDEEDEGEEEGSGAAGGGAAGGPPLGEDGKLTAEHLSQLMWDQVGTDLLCVVGVMDWNGTVREGQADGAAPVTADVGPGGLLLLLLTFLWTGTGGRGKLTARHLLQLMWDQVGRPCFVL